MFDLTIEDRFIHAGGHRLKIRTLGAITPSTPTLVFLHEGLGSIDLWKDYPENVARAAKLPALIYDRWGYGESDQLVGPRRASYRHVEALSVLPEVLAQFDIGKVILIGHSDGGCMSLLYSSEHQDWVLGVIALAPQVVAVVPPGEKSGQATSSMQPVIDQFESGGLREKLSKYHGDNTETMFYGWANAWGSREFEGWQMKKELGQVQCPVVIIIGDKDPYGYQHNIDELRNELTTPPTVLIHPEAAHIPHLEAEEFTLRHTVDAIESFGE